MQPYKGWAAECFRLQTWNSIRILATITLVYEAFKKKDYSPKRGWDANKYTCQLFATNLGQQNIGNGASNWGSIILHKMSMGSVISYYEHGGFLSAHTCLNVFILIFGPLGRNNVVSLLSVSKHEIANHVACAVSFYNLLDRSCRVYWTLGTS